MVLLELINIIVASIIIVVSINFDHLRYLEHWHVRNQQRGLDH